jgi:hypothetical protein
MRFGRRPKFKESTDAVFKWIEVLCGRSYLIVENAINLWIVTICYDVWNTLRLFCDIQSEPCERNKERKKERKKEREMKDER